jgi:hypothetical protein
VALGFLLAVECLKWTFVTNERSGLLLGSSAPGAENLADEVTLLLSYVCPMSTTHVCDRPHCPIPHPCSQTMIHNPVSMSRERRRKPGNLRRPIRPDMQTRLCSIISTNYLSTLRHRVAVLFISCTHMTCCHDGVGGYAWKPVPVHT